MTGSLNTYFRIARGMCVHIRNLGRAVHCYSSGVIRCWDMVMLEVLEVFSGVVKCYVFLFFLSGNEIYTEPMG